MENISPNIPLISLAPFILMLTSIAVFPLFWSHFWEKNRNKLLVALVLSTPITGYLLFSGLEKELIATLVFEYIPFIVLLSSLFTITGGIYLSGDIEATPLINTLFLATGAVFASFMGTTGAAMLLIRAIIQTNKERNLKVHTILFFIAIVANCGGLLTPLGDPPLFMMYLKGAPFTWFFKSIDVWLFVNGLLLVVYFIVDSYYYRRETLSSIVDDFENARPIRIHGKLNFIWLLGVVLSVAFINPHNIEFLNDNRYYSFSREAAILIMGVLSLIFTKKMTRELNNYAWAPIIEVIYLFLGIFITMVPCLLFMESSAKNLDIARPIQFYYFAGLLSSFLDNTPTAVAFHSLALGLGIKSVTLVAEIPETLLRAITTGAVLFGSMTYIGNGPNFMVKAIAEANGIKMPSFFSYILKFSIIFLLPIFIIAQLIFI